MSLPTQGALSIKRPVLLMTIGPPPCVCTLPRKETSPPVMQIPGDSVVIRLPFICIVPEHAFYAKEAADTSPKVAFTKATK